MGISPAVRDATRDWIAHDPDPETRAELQRLLAAALAGEPATTNSATASPATANPATVNPATVNPAEELTERMRRPLRFGTAGLRGPVRAGLAGMNVAVVRRTTAGLAAWLVARGAAGGHVVIGRDARHGSAKFAAATAEVFAGAGFRVTALAESVPTPVLAYAVRALSATAGVQITASHNPAADNGYKVFLGGPLESAHAGAQLVEPADAEVEAAIAEAPPADSIPTAEVTPTDPGELLASYLGRVAALPRGSARRLRIALTPLHGVGGPVAVRALRQAGFTDVHLVPEQAEPDPDFPTVGVPNPEEPGTTDALLALAEEIDADLAIALDPDADRCALGIPDRVAPGGWRMLTGNEVGVLLGQHLLATLDRRAHPHPLVATTIASSRLLRAVAEAHGAQYAETPTGFKWIVRAAVDNGISGSNATAGPAPELVYGYEEALGYCVDPSHVRDKDGISAAVLAADLAATRLAEGGSLSTALDELALAHGVHLTAALNLPLKPAPKTTSKSAAPAPPAAVLEKLEPGYRRVRADVLVREGDGQRVVIRPSGTEPKLKAYLEVVEPVARPSKYSLSQARARAAERLAALRAEVKTELGTLVGWQPC